MLDGIFWDVDVNTILVLCLCIFCQSSALQFPILTLVSAFVAQVEMPRTLSLVRQVLLAPQAAQLVLRLLLVSADRPAQAWVAC